MRIFGRRYAFADNLRPTRLERQDVAADFAELETSGTPSEPRFVLAGGRRPLIGHLLQLECKSCPKKGGQMKRSRFTEEHIIAILREHEAGAKAADLARRHRTSEAAIYNWKAKYGGMDVPAAKRLRALEDENVKLKMLLVEHMLGVAALRELLSK